MSEIISKSNTALDFVFKEGNVNLMKEGDKIVNFCTSAEKVCEILNEHLAKYGIQSTLSPDKTQVYLDDGSLTKVYDLAKECGFKPVIPDSVVAEVGEIVKTASKNDISFIWPVNDIKRGYYYFKQYGFQGVQLYNALNIAETTGVVAKMSTTGASAISFGAVLGVSWAGSLTLTIIDNHVPSNWTVVKATVKGARLIFSLPVRFAEWGSNSVTSVIEKALFGTNLPTNVTEVYRFNEGPEVKDLHPIKRSILKWLKGRLK